MDRVLPLLLLATLISGCSLITAGSVDRSIYQMLLDRIVTREMQPAPPVVISPSPVPYPGQPTVLRY